MTSFKEIIKSSLCKVYYLLLLLPVIWLLSGIYSVDQNEIAVPVTLGKIGDFTSAGIHYLIPYPFGEVLITDIKKTRTISIGFGSINYDGVNSSSLKSRIINYTGNSKETVFMDNNVFNQQFMTGDNNIIAIEMDIIFNISDPIKWLFNYDYPEKIIQSTAQSVLFAVLSKSSIDNILIRDPEMEFDLKEALDIELKELKCGIITSSIILKKIHLPADSVDSAFRDVKSAEDDRTKRIEDAKREATRTIAQGKTAAMQLQDSALVKATEITNNASIESELFKKMELSRDMDNLLEFRLYNETMERILQSGERYIVTSSGSLDTIYLNKKGN
ncbi:MAG: hypothetical protein GY760_06930 [Deltaproteobacteria bacterium]|nr:hypothetical protein [Deltaproteobacteria bacterium]